MKLLGTSIAGVCEIETVPHVDARGALIRLFCTEIFEAAGVLPSGSRFVQVNHSTTSRRGTVRGMHFQRAPALDTKLIRCLRGRVFDVAVDLREGSPTFGRWHGVELSEDNQRELLIPPGCAHGFQALTDDAQLLYHHTAAYAPQREGGVRHDDPLLGIRWPLAVALLSPRDAGHALISDRFEGVST
jgi:dTDP-4-dehydrorhamnose 3,5-epimerase